MLIADFSLTLEATMFAKMDTANPDTVASGGDISAVALG